MNPSHAVEAWLAEAAFAGLGALPWRRALGVGAAMGNAVRLLGIRREVARANLARAFPEKPLAEREALLHEHYRELGRTAIEYGRLPQMAKAPEGEYVARIEGAENLAEVTGKGALFLSGHLGNFELLAAYLSRYNPVDFLVKPQSNAAVDARVTRLRREAGVGVISTHGGVKHAFRALRAGHWLAIVGDQDARRHGVFVPFFGHLASTPEGPARLSIATGAPIVFGFVRREPDGRHALTLSPPHWPPAEATEENVRALTAWHTSVLEGCIRRAPAQWFWLHRRWKTAPPAALAQGDGTHAPV